MRTLTALAALVLCAGAFPNETTIEVPRGSGVFPTVGQLNCLEEAGSGRFCAATYECADESGDLWGDLANHDGRRAIGVDSPVAVYREGGPELEGILPGRYAECRTLLEEQWEREGFGELQ